MKEKFKVEFLKEVIIKKTQKTPEKEIEKATELMNRYFKEKK